jgi:hypothetical protein
LLIDTTDQRQQCARFPRRYQAPHRAATGYRTSGRT